MKKNSEFKKNLKKYSNCMFEKRIIITIVVASTVFYILKIESFLKAFFITMQ